MISLVTQSDGSARRVPWIVLTLAAAMTGVFLHGYEAMTERQAEADAALAEAVGIFRERPYLILPDELESVLPVEQVQRLRADWEAERADLGIDGGVPAFVRTTEGMR